MAIQQDPNTIINASGDPVLAQNEIALATANGGVFVYQTNKDIYVTEVTQSITNQSIKNIINNPAGNIDGEIQFLSGGKFGTDADFRYDTVTDTLALAGGLSTSLLTVSRHSNLGPVANVTITGGNANEVLMTDGAGSLSWGIPTSTYGDSNVAAFLTTYSGNTSSFAISAQLLNVAGLATLATANVTGNLTAGNANLGNLAQANFFSGDGSLLANLTGANVTGQVGNALVAGTVYTAAQPNITSVGTLTSLSASGNIGTTGNISATGNITGGNISTAGLITGGNLTVSGNVQADTAFVGDALVTRTGPLSLTATGIQNITLNTGTGNIALGTQTWITNVKDPVNAQDAATKAYVDAVAQGLKPKAAVNCATPNNISFVPAPGTIDGYMLNPGDRVLVKSQTNPAQNGIYTYDGVNLARSTDADIASELPDGTFAFVESGNTFAACGFVLTSVVTVLGVSPVVFTQFAQAATYSAGSGLSMTGTQFSIATTTVTPGVYGNATHVPSFVVSDTGQLTAASTNAVIANAATLSGTTLNPTVVTSSLTSVGTLGTLAVSGNANVGNIGAAAGVFTTVAGQLTTAAQPNITSLGTLTSLGVTGAVTAGRFAGEAGNLSNITGGNVTGNVPSATLAHSVAGANVSGQVGNALVAGTVYTAAQPAITSVGTLTSLDVTGGVTGASFTGAHIGAGNALSNIQGANVSGQVGFAAVANSVSGANVTTQVANALVAGTVYTAAQPAITSLGTLTGLTSGGTVDLTSASNVSLGPVANVRITGGTSGQVLTSAGSGTLQWTTPAAGIQSTYSATAPTVPTPATGDLWYDTTNSQSKVYDGTNWVISGSPIAAGITTTATGNLAATTVQAAITELDTEKLAIAGGTMTGDLILNSDPILALGAATKQMVDAKVTGPASSTDNAVVRYDSTTGKVVQNSGVTIDDANNLNGVVNLTFSGLATGDGGALANVRGSIITGTVSDATTAGTVTTAAQPNITSVGTLTGLTVGGPTNLGPVANVTITGGTSGQVLRTDGSGVLSWTTIGTSGISNGTSGVSVPAINGNVNTSVGGVANVLVVTSTGANVAGTLNATGDAVIGGTLNVTGVITGNITNSNTANFAGVVTTNAQPNITSVGTLTSLDVTGGVTAASFTGSHSGAGNNLSNIQGANVTGNVTSAVTANFANFAGNVTLAGQSNITSVGTLTGLTSGGVVDLTTASNVSLGAVANVKITGGTSGQVLRTDGTGNLSWITAGGGLPIANGTSNIDIPTVNGNINIGVGGQANSAVFTTKDLHLPAFASALIVGNITTTPLPSFITAGLIKSVAIGNINSFTQSAMYNPHPGTSASADFIAYNSQGAYVDIGVAGPNFANSTFSVTTASEAYLFASTETGNVGSGNLVIATNSRGTNNSIEFYVGGFTGAKGGSGRKLLITNNGVNLGSNANVTITGGTSGQVLSTNGSGGLSWITAGGGLPIENGTSNINIPAINGDVTISVGGTDNVAVFTSSGATFLGSTNVFGPTLSVEVSRFDFTIDGDYELKGNVNGLYFISDNDERVIMNDNGLTVRGRSTLGPASNVIITGGTNGQVLQTNGSGGLSWATVSSDRISNGTSDVTINGLNGNITANVDGSNKLDIRQTQTKITGKFIVDPFGFNETLVVDGNTVSIGTLYGGDLEISSVLGQRGNLTVGGKLVIASNAPASATATGQPGQIAWASGFIYVCVATNTWQRAALSTW